jgi:hypothetical protein
VLSLWNIYKHAGLNIETNVYSFVYNFVRRSGFGEKNRLEVSALCYGLCRGSHYYIGVGRR